MKAINILKNLITWYYYLILIGLIIKIMSTINGLSHGSNFKPKVLDKVVDFSTISNTKIAIMLVIAASLYGCYFMGIHYLKESLSDLSSGNYFSEKVIRNFNIIGKLFLICGIGEVIGKVILMGLIGEISLELESSMVLFLIMGLFFLFLSKVFLKARTLEQDNNLTI